MSEKLTSLAAENLNPGLRGLLEDVQRGHIRVPRFQRSFIWSDDQRIELLDSISKRMPIGSLLIWRTSDLKLATFNAVGPQTIPPIAEQAPATGWQYLLDGHQRVSTLLGLLLPPPENAGDPDADTHGKEVDWDIQYDLMDAMFVFARKLRKKNMAFHPLLPLWTLLDGRLVNRAMRELRKQAVANGWTEDNLEQWEERADRLAYRFQECRIPVVVMVTDDLDLATTTFQRVNTQGTAMGEADLVAALTWKPEFDLRERIKALREELPHGWRDLDDRVFLQVCKGLAGLDITRGDEHELVKRINKEPALLGQAGVGLQQAIELLEQEANVVNLQLLPYVYQLTLLAIALGSRVSASGAISSRHLFLSWFWRTGWDESFASASYRKVRSEQALVAQLESEPLGIKWEREGLSEGRFDFRLARTRLFLLRMSRRSDLCLHNGVKLDGRVMLAQYGRDAMSRLFSNVPANSSDELKKLIQGAGNQVFYPPAEVKVLRERLQRGPDLAPELLHSLFIDPVALQALREGDLQVFMESRFKAIDAWDEQEYKITMQQSGGSE